MELDKKKPKGQPVKASQEKAKRTTSEGQPRKSQTDNQ